jgi:DNA adenine methylase
MGGGALFFYLQPSDAVLIDINEELTNVYQVVRDEVEALIVDLKTHVSRHSKAYFYELRDRDRHRDFSTWSKVQRASRLIYLNKTCYNGLYRVNSKGYFNVPFGDYKNPTIVNGDNLRACSDVLQSAKILNQSFKEVESLAQKNDFIYFDPPYAPLSSTASFTSYSQFGFDKQMQIELRDLCDRLTDRKIKLMQSNSSAPLILELYGSKYGINFVDAARAINSKGDKRGKIKEAIVTNY